MTSMRADPIQGSPKPADQGTTIDIDEIAYQQILMAIVEQRLLPGTKLGEQLLSEKFGISRARLRRVLLRLAQDHMVTQHPHRGAFVAQPTLAEARDLMQARRAVEEKIVKLVLASITSRDIAELGTLIDHESAARNRGDRAAALRVASEFHLKLGEFAGNRVLYDILRDLVSRLSLVIAQNRDQDCPICPVDDHPGILEAIRVGDVEKAVAAMDEHLRKIERSLWHHGEGARHLSSGAIGRA